MMAAIAAARCGADVTIIEHMDRMGKKILSTGNGKCNMTNLDMREEYFRCSQKEFPGKVLKKFGAEDTLEFFETLGIVPKIKNGYVYPNSEQAASVLEVLLQEVNHLGIKVMTECAVKDIKPGKLHCVQTNQGTVKSDCVILAAGSKAAPVTGSDGSGYDMAKKLGHKIIQPLPALVQLRCEGKHYKQLAGIRTEAEITLMSGKQKLVSERGELQLTDYGISGIPVFQVSRYGAVALAKKQDVTAVIDFLPGLTMEETKQMLAARRETLSYKTAEGFMTGLLNKKLSGVLLKLAGIRLEEQVSSLKNQQLDRLLAQLKTYETKVTATNPYTNAQVCCGGVDTTEINAETMESKLVPGLYIVGELLDVDGICGGYNLQWAWSTGSIAGEHAGRG